MLSARMDYQDALASGLGVTEYARGGRAAQEVEALWSWTRSQFGTAGAGRVPLLVEQEKIAA
jgi:chromosome partitioning protein